MHEKFRIGKFPGIQGSYEMDSYAPGSSYRRLYLSQPVYGGQNGSGQLHKVIKKKLRIRRPAGSFWMELCGEQGLRLWRIPSLEPSFILMKSGSQSSVSVLLSTAYP